MFPVSRTWRLIPAIMMVGLSTCAALVQDMTAEIWKISWRVTVGSFSPRGFKVQLFMAKIHETRCRIVLAIDSGVPKSLRYRDLIVELMSGCCKAWQRQHKILILIYISFSLNRSKKSEIHSIDSEGTGGKRSAKMLHDWTFYEFKASFGWIKNCNTIM